MNTSLYVFSLRSEENKIKRTTKVNVSDSERRLEIIFNIKTSENAKIDVEEVSFKLRVQYMRELFAQKGSKLHKVFFEALEAVNQGNHCKSI